MLLSVNGNYDLKICYGNPYRFSHLILFDYTIIQFVILNGYFFI